MSFIMKRILPFALALLTGLAAFAQPYKDRSLPPQERAKDLVSRLNLEEKASLMWHTSAPVEALGIPAYNWWNEALHGVARNGKATVFPQPIGMAASFDDGLVNLVFNAASDEGRVKHRQALKDGASGHYQGLTYWTPNINLFRDPRWGRGMETYGEDPYLTGRMGVAVVRGLQGPSDAPVLKAHACAKHYAVHSGPEWNRHQFNAEVSERDLRESYLPAFKELVTKADVQEVMIAYNRFRGVPCGANDYLVNTILRGEWGYQGLVVSDCWAISDFAGEKFHNYSEDMLHAVATAVHNGTDLECGSSYNLIPEAVAAGLLDEADVDRSLVRLLTARFRLGEMDGDNSPWAHLPDNVVEGPLNRDLSLKIATESIVLLQNRDNLLPLDPGARIALIGPNADSREMQWGNYNAVPEYTITLADAMQERIPGLLTFRACGIMGAEYLPQPNPDNPLTMALGKSDEELEAIAQQYAIGIRDLKNYINRQNRMREDFFPKLDEDAVLKQLEDIDIVVFAGGISPRFEGEEMPVELPGFRGGDRTDIQLPEVQRHLLRRLHDAGKRIVLVNFSGAAMGLEPETVTCDAILQAWYPGEEGGEAIASILFGQESPSGKLPVTFYRSTDQLPDFENYDMKGRTYRFFEGDPLFAFGYGLSYTTFKYGKGKVKKGALEVPVTNTGKRDATEVVQLYVRRKADPFGPQKTLRGFQRVSIPAGKTVKVRIPLTEETFLGWSEEEQDMLPLKGKWELLYGGSSSELKSVQYEWK